MRKRIMTPVTEAAAHADQDWLNLEQRALVEVTSEDPAYPLESALAPGAEGSWRAAESGKQTLRLIFDQAERLKRIRVVFEDHEWERTQEFTLRWSPDGGKTWHEIVRQQWNFSPTGTVKEVEDYQVDLSGVTILQLDIEPNKSGGEARASLEELRLA